MVISHTTDFMFELKWFHFQKTDPLQKAVSFRQTSTVDTVKCVISSGVWGSAEGKGRNSGNLSTKVVDCKTNKKLIVM